MSSSWTQIVGPLPDDKQQQLAKRYADIFGVFLRHRDAVTRVTFWGLSDADSWLDRGRAVAVVTAVSRCAA